MPSKLRRAISAVKDQTSLGLALVSLRPGGSSDIDVAVLKATNHDEIPIEDRHLNEILLLSASSPAAASALVHVLSRRIARTRNWVVALKSLSVAHRALCEGGPHFPRESHAAGCRGDRLFDLSGFRDESTRSSPWDFTAFVRTLALYLDARLESFFLGKLHKKHGGAGSRLPNMKPPMVLERIGNWQCLLDRAIGTRPTGPAKTHRLVQIALYTVIRESFDLYRDISDGLSMLLDNFFHLPYPSRIETFTSCARAAKQFEELDAFYTQCKSIGVGRSSEYPSVQKISIALLGTLQEFLKENQASSNSPSTKLLAAPKLPPLTLARNPSDDLSSEALKSHRLLDWELVASDQNWPTVGRSFPASPSSNYCNVDNADVLDHCPKASSMSSSDGWELVLVETAKSSTSAEPTKPYPGEGLWGRTLSHRAHNYINPFLLDSTDDRSLVVVPSSPSTTPLPTFRPSRPDKEKRPPPPNIRLPKHNEQATEKILPLHLRSETTPVQQKTENSASPSPQLAVTNFHKSSRLEEGRTPPPTFRAEKHGDERTTSPTFRAVDPKEKITQLGGRDPFASPPFHIQTTSSLVNKSDEWTRQQLLLREQQIWIQHQSKIIAKNIG